MTSSGNQSVGPVLAFILFFLVPIVSMATPSPYIVEGDLINGGELVIGGEGFGAKTQAAPIIFDTQRKVWINGIESEPYAGIADGSVVPVGNHPLPWRRGNTGDVRLSKGAYPHYYGTFAGSNLWLEDPNGFPDPSTGEVQRVYIRWWFKMSSAVTTPVSGSQSNKFIRIRDTLDSDFNIGLAWTQMHATSSAGFGSSWTATAPTPDQWNLMELFWQLEPTGVFKAWLNGKEVHNNSGWSPPAGHGGIHPRLWGLNGSGVADFMGETLQLSDYYADSTIARVEIGDAKRWSEVRIREPQVAFDWTPTRIKIQLHQGLLDSLKGKYLFVVDSDGGVNEDGLLLGGVPSSPPSTVDVE